ncbi:hypothetical protein X772_02800 [Mesorhizobium sp. LSJC280B00]|nr:hypothetical protein X772_02800 [Mesorhizobium sp. LSJC280B00]
MPSVVDPPKRHVDAGLLADCNTVVAVPHRDMSLDETTRLWSQDRLSLGDCGKRHKALAGNVKVLTR